MTTKRTEPKSYPRPWGELVSKNTRNKRSANRYADTGRVNVPVEQLEAQVGGNTIWVHSPKGATVLRIKCTGKIIAHVDCSNPVSHADLMVEGDIELCLTEEDAVLLKES